MHLREAIVSTIEQMLTECGPEFGLVGIAGFHFTGIHRLFPVPTLLRHARLAMRLV